MSLDDVTPRRAPPVASRSRRGGWPHSGENRRRKAVRALLAVCFAAALTLAAPGRAAEGASEIESLRARAHRADVAAQFELGLRYYEGSGVPQDRAEAARWFREAAERGDAPAQYRLGIMRASGDGVAPDNMQAHMWLNLAAARMTGKDREDAIHNRFLVAQRMTPEQVAEAERRARDWKPIGVEK